MTEQPGSDGSGGDANAAGYQRIGTLTAAALAVAAADIVTTPRMSARKYRRAWEAVAAAVTMPRNHARRTRVDARAANDLLAEMDQQMRSRLDRWDTGRLAGGGALLQRRRKGNDAARPSGGAVV